MRHFKVLKKGTRRIKREYEFRKGDEVAIRRLKERIAEAEKKDGCSMDDIKKLEALQRINRDNSLTIDEKWLNFIASILKVSATAALIMCGFLFERGDVISLSSMKNLLKGLRMM